MLPVPDGTGNPFLSNELAFACMNYCEAKMVVLYFL